VEDGTTTYDPNGNVTSTGGKTFTYDAENHLVSMNGGAVTLVYDAFGNRVAKTVNGVTNQGVYCRLDPSSQKVHCSLCQEH
jgi:YD repeat-containing protein